MVELFNQLRYPGLQRLSQLDVPVSKCAETSEPDPVHPLARTISVIGFVFLLVGGWLGGSLVYGYGAGGDRKDGETSA